MCVRIKINLFKKTNKPFKKMFNCGSLMVQITIDKTFATSKSPYIYTIVRKSKSSLNLYNVDRNLTSPLMRLIHVDFPIRYYLFWCDGFININDTRWYKLVEDHQNHSYCNKYFCNSSHIEIHWCPENIIFQRMIWYMP